MSPLIYFTVAAGIAITAFFWRLLPRLIQPEAIGHDTYAHFHLAREVRRNGHRFATEFSNTLRPIHIDYPLFFHWLLSYIPEKNLLKLERYIAPLLDTLMSVHVLIFSALLLRHHEIEEWQPLSLICMFLFAISPALLRQGLGPRAYQASPRPLGQFLFLLFMSGCILYNMGGSWGWLVLAGVAAGLNTITTKLINQAILFVSLLLLLSSNYIPLVAALAGSLAFHVLTGGKTGVVLAGQYAHLKNYAKNWQNTHLGFNRTCRQYIAEFTGAIKALAKGEYTEAMMWFFKCKYIPHIIVFAFPHIIVGAALLLTGTPVSDMAETLLWWTGAGIACTLLTNLPRLRFLGEPERYMEATLAASIITLVLLAMQSPAALYLLAIYSMLFGAVSVIYFIKLNTFMVEVFNKYLPALAEIDHPENRIHHIGNLLQCTHFALRNARTLPCISVPREEEEENYRDFRLVYGKYPFPEKSVNDIITRYDLTHITTTPRYLKMYAETTGDLTFRQEDYKTLYDDGDFVILKLKGNEEQHDK